ncbi:MAG: efflux RND transporter periplasmic adaptor subunit [Planctomycetes bacterium]|nr:efflux RND transporter periplasmic adaptor subunit [Planctomycetota bacterium]
MRSRRWLVWGFLLSSTLVGGCSGTSATDDKVVEIDDRVEIETIVVRRSTITATLETVGTLLPVRSATIVSEIDGVIETLPDSDRIVRYEENGQQMSTALGLDIGAWVDEGDVLVGLKPTDFELALLQAQTRRTLLERRLVDLKESGKREERIEQLQAQVDEARAALDLAQAELHRNDRLMATGATTAGDHDEAQAAAQQAAAALAQAAAVLRMTLAGPTDEQIAVVQAEIDSAEVEVKRRQRDLEKATIRSPYPAVITDRYVGVGDRVTAMPRVEIMDIVDPRMLFAEIDVPERYLGVVKLDDAAEVRLPRNREVVYGKVELMNGRVDPATRTFRVRIGIDNRQGLSKPGGLARVTLPITSADDALVVPRTALTFPEGQPAVFVYHDKGFVERRSVRLGITADDACEIVDGLAEGELIASTRTALLADGLSVRRKAAADADVGGAKSTRPTTSASNKPVGREDLAHPTKMREEEQTQ